MYAPAAGVVIGNGSPRAAPSGARAPMRPPPPAPGTPVALFDTATNARAVGTFTYSACVIAPGNFSCCAALNGEFPDGTKSTVADAPPAKSHALSALNRSAETPEGNFGSATRPA